MMTRRAGRKSGQGSHWIRPVKRLAVYLRDGMACCYCGATVEDGATLTLDHVLACELGGDNHEHNLATCCLSCNSSKRDLTMRAWFQTLRDRGIDTSNLSRTIRRHTRRDLAGYKRQARRLLADRA